MLTDRAKADCEVAFALIKDIEIEIFADRGHGISDIVEHGKDNGIEILIPLNSQRKLKKSLMIFYILFVTTFHFLRCWRSIATCYFKTSIAFVFFAFIRSIFILIFSRF